MTLMDVCLLYVFWECLCDETNGRSESVGLTVSIVGLTPVEGAAAPCGSWAVTK